MKRIKIKRFYIEEIRECGSQYHVYICRAMFKVGLCKKWYQIMATDNPNYDIKIAYIESPYSNSVPEDKQENQKILTLAWRELFATLAEFEIEEYFEKRRKTEEERKRKEEEEKRLGIIKVGEQVTFEKYLKNIDKNSKAMV